MSSEAQSRESSQAAESHQSIHDHIHDEASEATEGASTPRGSRMDSEEMDDDTEDGDASSIYFEISESQAASLADTETASNLIDEDDEDQEFEWTEEMDEDEDGLEYDEDYDDGDGDGSEDEEEDGEEMIGGHQVLALMGNIFRAQLRFRRPQQSSARKRRQRPGQENLEPVPSEEGRELMWAGEFGQDDLSAQSPKRKRRDSSVFSPAQSQPPSPTLSRKSTSPSVSRKSTSPTLSRRSTRSMSSSSNTTSTPPVRLLKAAKPRPALTKSLTRRLLAREMGAYTGEKARIINDLMAQTLIPTKTDKILNFNKRCYSGQFSQDGNFFYCSSQDMNVRIYDTTNPYNWKYYKKLAYRGGSWTITDATLSPDNTLLAYSSINSHVFLASTANDGGEMLRSLDFTSGRQGMNFRTGIWSIRFSGDGREIVAGASDSNLYVYDLETSRPILQLRGHEDDVNAVCYGDTSSPHLLFSGSDDSTIKIWDRRSMASGREAGVFVGHVEGLTYIDSKGDGRYVLSNSKDQTMKLWDIRKMTSSEKFDRIRHTDYSAPQFDYRFMSYDNIPVVRHPHDTSVVTFRGHSVLKTLIRCHFSPPTSSGSRYVYSGSSDGRVHVYNMDATVAGVIDVQKATERTRPRPEGYDSWNGFDGRHIFSGGRGRRWHACVRDVSWHPSAPVLVATAWNGYESEWGTVTVHSWDEHGGGRGMRDAERKKTEAEKGVNDGHGGGDQKIAREVNDDGGEEQDEKPEMLDAQLRPHPGV